MRNPSFLHALEKLERTSGPLSLKDLISSLSEQGPPFLLLLLSLPLALPTPLPGISTGLGILIGLIGIRLGFLRTLPFPKRLLKTTLPSTLIKKMVRILKKTFSVTGKFLHPRYPVFIHKPLFIRINASLIVLLSLIFIIPFPLPFINSCAAAPVILLSLGLLEEDGLCVLFSYLLAGCGMLFLIYIFYFSVLEIEHLALFRYIEF